LRREALPLNEVLAAARQMAKAIQEAHEKWIIQRDLKPGKVKLTPSGQGKMLEPTSVIE